MVSEISVLKQKFNFKRMNSKFLTKKTGFVNLKTAKISY